MSIKAVTFFSLELILIDKIPSSVIVLKNNITAILMNFRFIPFKTNKEVLNYRSEHLIQQHEMLLYPY